MRQSNAYCVEPRAALSGDLTMMALECVERHRQVRP